MGVFRGSAQARGKLIILYYHSVPADKRVNFARQMGILARHGHVVPADWRGESDPSCVTVAITFDDAFTSVIDNALPELAERGFPCTIFVPSGMLGRSPDWPMEDSADHAEVVVDSTRLKELPGALVAIGAHTVNHPHLTRIAPELAQAEIGASRAEIARIIGRPVTMLAFPYGDYNASVVNICQQEGFRHVFTIVPEPVDLGDCTLIRGRISINPDDGDLEFFLKMSGAYAWMPLVSALKRRMRSVIDAVLNIIGRAG